MLSFLVLPVILLSLIPCLISVKSENIFYMISIILNVSRFILWPKVQPTLVYVLWLFGNKTYSGGVGGMCNRGRTGPVVGVLSPVPELSFCLAAASATGRGHGEASSQNVGLPLSPSSPTSSCSLYIVALLFGAQRSGLLCLFIMMERPSLSPAIFLALKSVFSDST